VVVLAGQAHGARRGSDQQQAQQQRDDHHRRSTAAVSVIDETVEVQLERTEGVARDSCAHGVATGAGAAPAAAAAAAAAAAMAEPPPAPAQRPLAPFSGVLAMEGQLCGLLSQLEPCLPADGFDKLEARLQARLRPLRRLAPGDGRLDALKLDYGYVQRAVARQQPVLKVTAALRTLLVTAHGVLQGGNPPAEGCACWCG
jgi:hypothetical protein